MKRSGRTISRQNLVGGQGPAGYDTDRRPRHIQMVFPFT
ncbi:hypothetical protein UGMREWDR_CDS0193 [Aeromonas phage GomatiRiver_11]|nr:hypothetical protein UGMREWDR_CDS0193 [Aeromonas phage GomatiRiver_11]